MDSGRMSEQEQVHTQSRSASAPRMGSFITIAVAILLLFGALSRFGKLDQTAAYFTGLDNLAESRIRHEEARLKTAITLGGVPVSPRQLHPKPESLPINPHSMPPRRQDTDPELVRQVLHPPADSAPATQNVLDISAFAEQPADETQSLAQAGQEQPSPVPAKPARPKTVTVEATDTWFKIAQRTLGDGKRWQEILNINPGAKNGLRPGMTLAIPQ